MIAEATHWNVVIVGAWNLAILTPDGIRKRLFKLPEGTPVDVEVSIDRPGPYRVKHGDLLVVPSSVMLEVIPLNLSRTGLEKASQLALTALEGLPETPVFAAGMNIRFKYTDVPVELLDLVKSPLDDVLSDHGFTIRGGAAKRSMTVEPGVVNLEITTSSQPNEGQITLNFHRDSTDVTHLREWLRRTSEFFDLSKRLSEALNAKLELAEAP